MIVIMMMNNFPDHIMMMIRKDATDLSFKLVQDNHKKTFKNVLRLISACDTDFTRPQFQYMNEFIYMLNFIAPLYEECDLNQLDWRVHILKDNIVLTKKKNGEVFPLDKGGASLGFFGEQVRSVFNPLILDEQDYEELFNGSKTAFGALEDGVEECPFHIYIQSPEENYFYG